MKDMAGENVIPTEFDECKNLAAYLRIRNLPFTHIPNETGSSPDARRRAIRMKQQGTSPGFPDYLIVVKGQLVVIEMKRLKGSATSAEQVEWIARFNAIGIPARICKGFDGAKQFIEEVENGQTNNRT